MTLELLKTVAVRLAPVVLGAIIGVGGTKAIETKTTRPEVVCQKVEVICKVQKPDPIKVEFVK